MKKYAIKRMLCVLLGVMCMLSLSALTVSADSGPKPSVNIAFEGLSDELCYGTLLSARRSTGPSSAWDGNDAHAYHTGNEPYALLDYDVWRAFAEYEDADGYYFLQEGWRVDETKELAWTYYPPSPFKVLLYFPQSDTFLVSEICERYAFDSYFTLNVKLMEIERSYDYSTELWSLAARIVVTLALELSVALLFAQWSKKQLWLIVGVNVLTQLLLNVLLNVINYNMGELAFTVFYVLFEWIVFAIEAAVFSAFLNKLGERQSSRRRLILLALVSNAVSFGVGLWLARVIPGIF